MGTKIVYILWIIGLFATSLNAEDVLVPYDDDGFYGGTIILMALLYIGVPIALVLGVGGVIAYFIFPKVIQEFRLIVTLYDTMEFKKALTRHFFHLLFFTPVAIAILYFTYLIFHPSYWYLFALFLFLYSSFFGFYLFLYFAMALYLKNWKKVLISLILGGGIFFVFAPSGYFVFEPVYRFFNQKETKKEKSIGYDKNISHSVDIFTTLHTSLNVSEGEKERKERFKELEKTRSYNYYLNMKPSKEVTNVKMVSFYEDFLVAKSSYEFTYLATPKYFEFLATHDKYPKADPKNVPVHKVSCNDFSKSKTGDECYFGVLYPYFHNIIYTPKTKEVRHSVGYYCW